MLTTKIYTIGYDYGYSPYFDTNKYRAQKYLYVFVYSAHRYNDNNKLHTYHNRKRVWSACSVNRKPVVCNKRAAQVDKWCKLTGAKCEIKKEA